MTSSSLCFRIARLAAGVEGEKKDYRSVIESVSLRIKYTVHIQDSTVDLGVAVLT